MGFTLPEWFLAQIDVTPECWNWSGYIGAEGYGRLRRHDYAHRVAYELAMGPIPDGLQIDHLCRNRACCNPDHLEPVTREENWRRGREARGKSEYATHCKNGHEWTPESTYLRPDNGSRQCRICWSVRWHRYHPEASWR